MGRPPARGRLEPNDLDEVMEVLKHLRDREGRVRTAPPSSPLLGAHDQIGVTHHLRLLLAEERRTPRLQPILLGDQQVAAWAVSAGLVQSDQLHRVDVDHQWQLADPGLLATLWARREAGIGVGVEKEAVARRLLPETPTFLGGARPPSHQPMSSMGSILSSPHHPILRPPGARAVGGDRSLLAHTSAASAASACSPGPRSGRYSTPA